MHLYCTIAGAQIVRHSHAPLLFELLHFRNSLVLKALASIRKHKNNTTMESGAITASFKRMTLESLTDVDGDVEVHINCASRRALSNHEILENVLSYLNFDDVVRARQGSTDFKAVADRSKTLRKTLWLERGEYEVPDQDRAPFHPDFFFQLDTPPRYDIPLERPHPLLAAGGFEASNRFFNRQSWAVHHSDVSWESI